MYSPSVFKNDDHAQALDTIRAHPFATVITTVDGAPFVSHLPLLAEATTEGEIKISGHMARANPHWRHFKTSESLFIFHGPHTYVTPGWYKNPLNVPTWNYVVIHAYGTPKLIEDYEGLQRILESSVAVFEKAEASPWKLDLPLDFRKELTQAIVGFEVRVERLEAKFKLSQNRDPEDRQGVLEGLRSRPDEMSRKVLEMMLKQPDCLR